MWSHDMPKWDMNSRGRNGVGRQLSSPCVFGLEEKRRMRCAKALVPALPVTTYASQPCSTWSPSISSQYAKCPLIGLRRWSHLDARGYVTDLIHCMTSTVVRSFASASMHAVCFQTLLFKTSRDVRNCAAWEGWLLSWVKTHWLSSFPCPFGLLVIVLCDYSIEYLLGSRSPRNCM
jgi:hypothetical protein